MNLKRRSLLAVGALVLTLLISPAPGAAAAVCGTSANRQVCITLPPGPLSGHTVVTVTLTPNAGTVTYRWVPDGKSDVILMKETGPSPITDDYSFTWPTEKYLNGSGSLNVRVNNGAPISVATSLSNPGNDADYTHSPDDWQGTLPGPWTAPTDPVIAAVGDGPDGGALANSVAASIEAASLPLFLFLGDIYESGTFTENLNHYGVSALDVVDPADATAWGRLTPITQPIIGNHEDPEAWRDYFHQRPLYTAYTYGGVLFLALASQRNAFLPGSDQYTFVQNELATAPGCVVAYFHHPAINGDKINPQITPMWELLADGGADLLLTGHVHSMAAYKPLDANFQEGPNAHLIELISGAGGHSVGASISDPQNRIAWKTTGNSPGVLYLTLTNARNGQAATGISWEYRSVNGAMLPGSASSTTCSALPAPTVATFTPTSGGTGDSVSVTGTGFVTATAVTLGGTAATFSVQSDSSLTFTVPEFASSGPICVTNAAETGCSADPFTVQVPSQISRVDQIGSTANLSGTTQNTLSVQVGTGGVPAGDTVVIGVAAQGAVTVSATDDAGNVYQVDATRPYSGTAACTSALLSAPVTNPLAAGQSISVTVSSGKVWGFAADQWRGMAGVADQTGSADSGGTISSTVSVSTNGATTQAAEAVIAATCIGAQPGLTPGNGYTLSKDLPMTAGSTKRELGVEFDAVTSTGQQTATFQLGTARNWSAVIATYGMDPPAPTVTDLSPTSGVSGATVTITGTDLTGANAVTFNGTAASFTVDSATSITATVPAGAATGPVCVTTDGGTGCGANPFTVTPPPAPTVTDVSPASGAVGDSVTITGTDLTGASAVTFDGTDATSYTVDSATTVTATVPAGATTGPVCVTTGGGTGCSADPFTVNASAPTVTDVSPASGAVGDSVTITGTDLTGASAVTFDGTDATSYTVDSATTVTATVPVGATTGPVCVTTGGGTGCSADPFTVNPTPPSITYAGQVGWARNDTGTTTNSLSVTVGPGGVAAGQTLVVGIAAQNAVDVIGVTDSAGNPYHVDVTRRYGGAAACTSAIASAHVTSALASGQTITVTVSSGKAWGFVVDKWDGLSGGVDRTGSSDSAGATSSLVSVSTGVPTSKPNEAVISLTCIAAQPGVTAGTGFTLSKDLLMSFNTTKRELGFEYQIVGTVGTQTATFQLGASRNWSAVIVTLG